MFPMVDRDVYEVFFFAGLGVCPLVMFESSVYQDEVSFTDMFGGAFGLFIPEFEKKPIGSVLPFSAGCFEGG